MTTVSQLIDDCSGMLHSYTGLIEATTYLTQTITATTTTIPVGHPSRLLQGIIEIDDELMWVSDQGDTSVTLFPAGRGAMNTTAVPHAATARVTNDPLVPRARLFSEIQATIRQLQQDLYSVGVATFKASPVQTTYEIPADVKKVLAVQWEVIGPSREWITMAQFWVDMNAATATGKSITLRGVIDPGRTVQVVYARDLPVPTSTSDDLEGIGIPPEMHDVIRLGAAWRAVQMLAPARINLRSVEAHTNAEGVTPSSVSDVAKQMFAMFQMRREEERKRLLDKYPTRKHYVRQG